METQLPERGHSTPTFRPMYCGQTAGWMNMPLGTGYRPRPRPHYVTWGHSSSKKGAQRPPLFGQCILRSNGWMDQHATWYRGRPRLWPHLLDEDTATPKGHSPQFSTHVCCDQTAGWIKMPLGREVGLGLGDIVTSGSSPPPKGAQ